MREHLVETITAELELGGETRPMLTRVLEIICEAAGCVVGHLYWRDLVSVEPVLISSNLWYASQDVTSI